MDARKCLSMETIFGDIAIKNSFGRFRYRSCGIIINDGKILMATNKDDSYFYSVGGAVKMGETAEEACLREVFEETGEHFEIERLAFIHEKFFKINGENWHELAFYFLMKTKKLDQLKIEKIGKQEEMVWLAIDELTNVEAYPLFYAQELPQLINSSNLPSERIAVERIVTHE